MAFDFDISRSGFTIRQTHAGDQKAFRMLLSSTSYDALQIVAEDAGGLIVAAGGLTRAQRSKPPVGPAVAVHVIQPCRNHGIGTAVLDGLVQFARGHNCQALYAANRVELNSPEFQAWQWLRFEPCETVKKHVLPLAEFEPTLAPLVERMRAKGRIPQSARIIPLYEADAEEVADLHLAEMGGNREELLRRMSGVGSDAFAPRHSRVLLLDGRVVGVILGHRTSRDVVHVDADIVDSNLRGTWANVWLKLEATRGALDWGVREFHYTTFDHYSDTRSFTEKLSGTTTQTLVLMHRRL